MKLLPIEEGCEAIIIHSARGFSKNVGLTVTVGRFRKDVNAWETLDAIKGTWTREENLMRIDGNEDLFKSEEEKLELVNVQQQ